jgi:hypothetical protein
MVECAAGGRGTDTPALRPKLRVSQPLLITPAPKLDLTFGLPFDRNHCFDSSTMTVNHLSIQQLRKAIDLKEKIEGLENQLATLLSGSGVPSPFKAVKTGKKGMSAAGRARIAAAQKLRWSKIRTAKPVKQGRKKMSASAKAKISAAAKLRWAKVKAAGKKRL